MIDGQRFRRVGIAVGVVLVAVYACDQILWQSRAKEFSQDKRLSLVPSAVTHINVDADFAKQLTSQQVRTIVVSLPPTMLPDESRTKGNRALFRGPEGQVILISDRSQSEPPLAWSDRAVLGFLGGADEGRAMRRVAWATPTAWSWFPFQRIMALHMKQWLFDKLVLLDQVSEIADFHPDNAAVTGLCFWGAKRGHRMVQCEVFSPRQDVTVMFDDEGRAAFERSQLYTMLATLQPTH